MPRAAIAATYAVYALAKLYSELLGANRSEDAAHVAATIRLLRPRFDLSAVRPIVRKPKNKHFRNGEMFRLGIEVLRTANGPMTTRAIALAVFTKRGIVPTKAEERRMQATLRGSLIHHTGTRVVREPGRPARWSLVR